MSGITLLGTICIFCIIMFCVCTSTCKWKFIGKLIGTVLAMSVVPIISIVVYITGGIQELLWWIVSCLLVISMIFGVGIGIYILKNAITACITNERESWWFNVTAGNFGIIVSILSAYCLCNVKLIVDDIPNIFK